MTEAAHYDFAPALGGIRVKLTQSGRGVNVELSVHRPRAEGETYQEAKDEAVALAKAAYDDAQKFLEATTLPISIEDARAAKS